MNKLLIIFIILFISCNSNKYKDNLLGLWILSEQYHGFYYYAIFSMDTVFFNDGFYPSCSPYKVSRTNMSLKYIINGVKQTNEGFDFEYLIMNDTLLFIHEKYNNIDTFYKSEYDNFLDEFLCQSNLKINLPEIKPFSIILMSSLCKPIFIGWDSKTNSVEVEYDGKRVDSVNLSKKIKGHIFNTNKADRSKLSFALYIDQNVTIRYIKKILNTIDVAWNDSYKRTLYFIVNNKSIFNPHKFGFEKKLPYFTSEYSKLSNFYNESLKQVNKSEVLLDSIGNIFIDGEKSTKDEFRKFIKIKIVSNMDKSEVSILDINENLDYSFYLKTLEYIYSIRDTLRNAYAYQTFGKPYQELESDKVYLINRKVDFLYSDFITSNKLKWGI